MQAFTILRSQTNSCTDALVGNFCSAVVLSAQQAADLQWQVLLKDPVARYAVERATLCMHTFNTGQQIFQAFVRARVREQQAVARQHCGERLSGSMRTLVAVSDCWAHVLQKSRCMAAALASIMSSQKLVHIHLGYTQAFMNKIEAVVAINASEAVQRQTPEEAAPPSLVSCSQDADVMASAVTDSQRPDPSGFEHARMAASTGPRTKSGYRAKRHTKHQASTSKSSNLMQLASSPKATESRLKSQSLSPQRPRAASGWMQHSPTPISTSTRHKDIARRHRSSTAADYSRFAQLLSSQHMPAPHAAYMQEVQEIDTATEELFGRMHALPQRLRNLAHSHFVPETLPQDIRSPQEASASLEDERRLEKPQKGQRS
jgi:hypothetical protein